MNLLGIDIGGTGIKGAPVNPDTGELLAERFRLDTPRPARPADVARVVRQVMDHFGGGIDRVGITFPGVVKSGVVRSAANMDKEWIGLDAGRLFVQALGVPAAVMNDADAAGVAEMHFGAGQGVHGVVQMVTLGTGIGSALFLDGKLLPNTEFGHLEIRGKDSELRASERARETRGLNWKKWGGLVGEYLARLEALLSPDLFIIGGGVSKKADKFFPHVKKLVTAPVVAAKLQNEAGIVGAAFLARSQG